MFRTYNIYFPHEVTAVIPRLEYRIKEQLPDGEIIREKEYILSSITLVHAPRHPLAGERPPGAMIYPGGAVLPRG